MSTQTSIPSGGGTEPGHRSARGGRRWLTVALVLSLCVNLLFLGAVIGRWSRGPVFHAMGPHAAWTEGHRMFRELPPDRRRAILGEMRGHREEFAARRTAIREARLSAARVLAREDATPGEIAQAFKTLGRREGETVETLRSIMGDVVIALTPQERRMFARRVLEIEPRRLMPGVE